MKLADRSTVDPTIVKEWIKQAKTWVLNGGEATKSQLELAWAVLKQWGTK